MTPPTPKQLAQDVKDFNERSPDGSWINYREIMPHGSDPGTPAQLMEVKTEAYVHQGHTAAVFLVGKRGFVDIHHCVPAESPFQITVKSVVEPVTLDALNEYQRIKGITCPFTREFQLVRWFMANEEGLIHVATAFHNTGLIIEPQTATA